MKRKDNKELICIPSSSPPSTPIREENHYLLTSSPIECSPIQQLDLSGSFKNNSTTSSRANGKKFGQLAMQSRIFFDTTDHKKYVESSYAAYDPHDQPPERDVSLKESSNKINPSNFFDSEQITKINAVKKRFPALDSKMIIATLEKFNWRENITIHKLTFQKLLGRGNSTINKSAQKLNNQPIEKSSVDKENAKRKRYVEEGTKQRQKKKPLRVIELSDEETNEDDLLGQSPTACTTDANIDNSIPENSDKIEEVSIESSGPSEVEDEMSEYDVRVLNFLNESTLQEIVDVSGCESKVVEYFISKRPFPSLEKAEALCQRNAHAATGKRKKSDGRNVGRKLVNSTYEVLQGFDAVDSLIAKCERYGAMISNTMRSWHNLFDDKKMEQFLNTSTGSISYEYNSQQPSSIASGITLKSYQIVGLNWLCLMYKAKLSGILADEMGLGKTCQVISFLASLKEKGIQNRHLVVVPSSTLGNWLREFEKFCPSLRVESYSGTQSERINKRYYLMDTDFDVLVTTYQLASGSRDDRSFLRKQRFDVSLCFLPVN